MSHRIGFGVVTAAMTALVALGPSCQKSPEMRPASGVNPEYDGEKKEAPEPTNAPSAYPQPGSGTGVPGTQTTPGATEPGADSEIPRGGDRTTLQPGGFPVEDDTRMNEPTDTWGGEPTTGGTGGTVAPKTPPGKGTAGHSSY